MANPYTSANRFVRAAAGNSAELSRLGKLGAKARARKAALAKSAEQWRKDHPPPPPKPEQGILFPFAPYPD